MQRLLIASPHRYADLARLWHRFALHELVPAFARLGLEIEVHIFCDANACQFTPGLFPGVVLSESGPGMRDFIEFYDATLRKDFDFIFFVDADIFFLDGNWASSYFKTFNEPNVAAVSFVPRKSLPAIFALLCRGEMYRKLPSPVFACRYEFPEIWPDGTNLQPGDFARIELRRKGKRIVNVNANESSNHVASFRSTTGIRSTREHFLRSAGEEAFEKCVAQNRAYIAAAYDNILLAALYERLFGEPFALDSSGTALAGSMTATELRRVLNNVRDPEQIRKLELDFQRSERAISAMSAREGVPLSLPSTLTGRKAVYS